ncbi:MAG: Helix-turn-helix domain protein [Syntrophorhabdus sp. PtaB.Bin047]|jgi:predicted DNA-binding transcriptional regulator AlpA|nr:MAG: Helix-turn-helix domain protein [Syntrophorhabdus sp. PtaB.Bin047]
MNVYFMDNGNICPCLLNITKEADVSTNKAEAKRLLTEKEVANIYGLKLSTLRNWRSVRQGPRFLKLNTKKVMYRQTDIEEYLDSCTQPTVFNTAE